MGNADGHVCVSETVVCEAEEERAVIHFLLIQQNLLERVSCAGVAGDVWQMNTL